MSDYPSDWKIETIGDACEIHDSRRIPLGSEQRRERKGPHPYYGANNIQDSINDFIFDFDAVLLAEDGGYYDDYETRDIAQYATGKYWVNNHAHILTGRDHLDTKFLYYTLVRKNICPWINTGTRAKLNQADMRQIEIAVPPLPEQKKIAEILSGIDQLTKYATKKIDKLKVARNALVQNLSKEDAQGWVSIGEISDFVTSGSRGWSQYYSGKGARFVRIGNLSRHSIDLDADPDRWQLVDPPKGAEGERTRLQDNDILISITADLGICCIYSEALGEAYINQHIALVRIDSRHKKYSRQVAYYICSEHCQEQIRSMNDSGAKAGLNLDSIRKIQVPLIEGGEDSKFIQGVDSLQDAIMRSEYRLRQLTKAKNALSADLLSGRKRVSV